MKVIIAIVLLAVVGAIALFAMSSNSVLSISPEVKVVGVSTPVTVKIANPHGVRRMAAYMEQGGTRYPLTEVKTPSHRCFWRRNQAPQTLTFEAGKSKAPNLKEGDARLDRGGGVRRPRGTHGYRVVRRQSDSGAAARGPGRRPALHQSGRHGTGRDDALRIVDRGGREGGQVHLPQFPPARGVRSSASPCSPIPGTWPENVTPMVFARNPGGHGGHRAILVQAFSEEIPRPRFPDR